MFYAPCFVLVLVCYREVCTSVSIPVMFVALFNVYWAQSGAAPQFGVLVLNQSFIFI